MACSMSIARPSCPRCLKRLGGSDSVIATYLRDGRSDVNTDAVFFVCLANYVVGRVFLRRCLLD
jgi:hypothetical protein